MPPGACVIVVFVPECCNASCSGRRPVWMNKELLLRLQKKKRVYIFSKKGQATRGDCKEFATVWRKEVRKAKAQLELRLATAAKEIRNPFTNISVVREEPRRISILHLMK